MLPKLKRRAVVATVLALGIGALALHHLRLVRLIPAPEPMPFTRDGFHEDDRLARESSHFSAYKFSFTDEFLPSDASFEVFSLASLHDQCVSFFSFLDKKTPDWEVSLLKGRHYDKRRTDRMAFFEDRSGDLKAKAKKAKHREEGQNKEDKENNDNELEKEIFNEDLLGFKISNENLLKIESLFEESRAKSVALENEMADTMTIIRIFGHCFFSQESEKPSSEALQDIYNRYSRKILPFLTQKVPHDSHVESYGGSKYFGTPDPDVNMLDFYYNNLEGDGIVISCATQHSRDVVRLIHTLRALGNTLPIQVMYRSDLLVHSKRAIVLAAIVPKDILLGEAFSKLSVIDGMFTRTGFSESDLHAKEFPTQSITLVNMEDQLSNLEKGDFQGFNSKISALFFSSFRNIVLLDADSVPLISPSEMLQMREFSDTGAYFFKDRSLFDKNDWVETNYFSKLMPHLSSTLDMAFGIKPVTAHTMENEFMTGWRHFQEAGIVLWDKRNISKPFWRFSPLSLGRAGKISDLG